MPFPPHRRVSPPHPQSAMPLLQLFLSLFLTIKSSHAALLLLPLTKDPHTLQYTTQLLIGTPQFSTNLLVDLSGQSLWLNCPPSSSSRHLIAHGSLQCLMAKSTSQRTTPPATLCNTHHQNPITGAAAVGDLAEDVVTFAGIGSADNFLFSCSPEYLLQGLVNGARGVLGLGRSKIAFQSQLVNSFDIPRKFAICLSSSDGFLVSGTGVSSNSLSYTPLVGGSSDDGYYVNVNSVKISGRRVAALQPIGGVQISSVVPYTTMKSTVYTVFTKAYLKAAGSMNMTRVAPVAPFGVCFRSQRAVPEMELVLQSELVKWRIRSMVQVSDAVMCLGVVDGGLDLTDSVVVGGYQLEDHILEFNLGTGMMGFTSSGNSCSKISRTLVSRSTGSL